MEKQKITKSYYDQQAHERKDFKPNQDIVMQKGKIWVPARVLNKHESPRSYMVEAQNGTVRKSQV